MPNIVRCFFLAIVTNTENNVTTKFGFTHSRRVDDAHDIGVADKYNAKYSAVFDFYLAEPSDLLQYPRISQMRVINYDQDMIVGDATTNEELLGDVPQLACRARNFLKSNLCQESAVELLLAMASLINNHTRDLIANGGDETV